MVRGAFCALAMLVAAGCATPPEDPAARAEYDEANDPVEPFNRFVFDVNLGFDKYFLKPIATAYRDAVPEGMRDAAHNFLQNLRSPLILVHDVLQGEPHRASVTFRRFLVNSVVGFAGLVDVADMALGLPFHDEDFGQTLAVWGAGEGFYLVLPLFGPSNVRDAVGLGVDSVINPTSIALNRYGPTWGPFALTVLSGLDQRSRAIDSLEEVERTAIDFYATLRSLYRQKRENEIANGRPTAGHRDAPTVDTKVSGDVPTLLGDTPTPTALTASPVPVEARSLPSPQAAAARGHYETDDWAPWAGSKPLIAFNPPSVPPPMDELAAPSRLAAYRPAAAAPAPVAPARAQPPLAAAPSPLAASPSPLAVSPMPAPPPMPAPAAAQPVPQAGAPAMPGRERESPVATILFRSGSAGLTANDRALLRHVAVLAQQNGAGLRVVGHAGESAAGLDELSLRFFNFDMSWARASAAAEELERAGLPLQHIVIEAKGEMEPMRTATAPDDSGNRRVVVYFQ